MWPSSPTRETAPTRDSARGVVTRADDDHRTRCIPHDVIGHRTEERAFEASSSPRTEDNGARLKLACEVAHARTGSSAQDHGLDIVASEKGGRLVHGVRAVGLRLLLQVVEG